MRNATSAYLLRSAVDQKEHVFFRDNKAALRDEADCSGKRVLLLEANAEAAKQQTLLESRAESTQCQGRGRIACVASEAKPLSCLCEELKRLPPPLR